MMMDNGHMECFNWKDGQVATFEVFYERIPL